MNVPLTLVRFLRYAQQQFPRETAIVCGDPRLTYADFGERVGRPGTTSEAAGAVLFFASPLSDSVSGQVLEGPARCERKSA